MPRMLDLCSGLGGASEAFVRAGWEVVRIDNNPLIANKDMGYYVPYTMQEDVLAPELDYFWKDLYYDFIWASPPCVEFSNAYSAPKPTAQREGRDFKPDMSIVKACHEIIKDLKPRYWVIENVSGSSKFISDELKMPPWQIVGPFFLWGKFPRICMEYDWTHRKADHEKTSTHPLAANIKARLPLEISEAFLDAFQNQTTLERWTR